MVLGWSGEIQRILRMSGITTKKIFPYKLSTYLSAGLPVVVPDYLSNADYIREKGLGFVASSLEEANRLVQDCTEEAYAQMVQKAHYTSYLIRNGYFTKEIIRRYHHGLG